jgi:hypothetical protein
VATSADGTKLVAAARFGISDGTQSSPPGLIYTSKNSGSTWIQTSAPTNHWVTVASSADGSKLAAAADTLIYTSSDSGATWTSNSVPARRWVSLSSSADGCKLLAADEGYSGADPGGIYEFQTTAKPLLSITSSSTELLLSWIVPSISFVLQQNQSLAAGDWTNVSAEPTLNYNRLRNEVRVQAPTGQVFYRLAAR